MSMTNFRAEDMPGNSAPAEETKPVAKPKAEEKKAPAKKPVAKKAPAKKAEPKSTEDDKSETETHGVGPSTVEGKKADDTQDDK